MPTLSALTHISNAKRALYPDEWHRQHCIPGETTLEPHESEASVLLGLTKSQVELLALTTISFGILATAVCCLNELTKLKVGIDPALIPLIGTGIPLCIGYRLTRSHTQWCKQYDAWRTMHRLSRSLARIIWTEYRCVGPVTPEESRRERARLIGVLATIMIAARNIGDLDFRFSEDINKSLWLYVEHDCPVSISPEDPSAKDGVATILSLRTRETQLLRRLNNALTDTVSKLVLAHQLPDDPMSNKLDSFIDACERLAAHSVQVLPVSCKRIIRLSVWAFLALLPFQTIDSLHWFTIPVQIMTTAVYIVLSEIEINSEAPFKGGYDGSSLGGFVKVWEEAELKDELGQT